MKFTSVYFSLLALVCCATLAFGQEKEATPKQCKDGACQEQCKDGTCPIAKAMKDLPQMTYRIGEENTCCSKSADELAKKHNKPIQFVVAKKTYDKKEKAMVALVESTEKFVKDFVTPCKCEVSGSTKIAGQSCNCPVDAGKKTELVKAAVSKVKMSYAVGEKTCNCPKEASAIAAKSGAKKEFVVAGKKTCCEMTARLNLAHAQYKAAVEAMLATNKKAETEATAKKAGS